MEVKERINGLKELNNLRWSHQQISEHEYICRCPKKEHKDEKPSCSFNSAKNIWFCHACNEGGGIVSFIAAVLNKQPNEIEKYLEEKYGVTTQKYISPETVERYHEKIWSASNLLKELRKRAVSDEMIRYARLGADKDRITIPVYDELKKVVNLRKYKPGAISNKIKNSPGRGKGRLYQIEDLKYDTIWICGGEIKALVAGFLLRATESKIGAISSTTGEGSWKSEWTTLLQNKTVYICMDIDGAGEEAAIKIASRIHKVVNQVLIIRLPLDKNQIPKGDINDYVYLNNANGSDLLRLMRDAEPFRQVGETKNQEYLQTTLDKASSANNTNKRLTFSGMITAIDQVSYLVPRRVRAYCSKDQPQCGECPIFSMEPSEDKTYTPYEIPAEVRGILGLVDAHDAKLPKLLQQTIGIPNCKSVTLVPETSHSVHDARLTPILDISDEGSHNDTLQPAYIVKNGVNLELNNPYNFQGVLYSHPKNQKSVVLVSNVEKIEDSLDTFRDSDDYEERLEELQLFQPEEWTEESLKKKLNHLYTDIESNVTRIFCRRDLHLVIDLTYFSCLLFEFEDREVYGWINSLIVGDTAQGKSETSIRLREFYNLGERVVCKSVSRAGLIGGLQQLINNKWFITWGVIPTNDRKLVILEELKGMTVDQIGKLTDLRSSGIAEISKIERQKARARTRLLCISNPRSDRDIASYTYGALSLIELIGNPEDLRRFDVSLVLSSKQIKYTEIKKRRNIKVDRTYTKELNRNLALFAWTRGKKEIEFEDDCQTLIIDKSDELCEKYSEHLPLIDQGTTKLKIARMAVALACRTFSVDPEHIDTVIVRKCHAEFITAFLDKIYSNRYFGYDEYSNNYRSANNVSNPEEVKAKIKDTKHPLDFVNGLLRHEIITKDLICDLCDLEKQDAQTIISLLVRTSCLCQRKKSDYIKSSDFTEILKELEEEFDPNVDEYDYGGEI